MSLPAIFTIRLTLVFHLCMDVSRERGRVVGVGEEAEEPAREREKRKEAERQ